MNEWVEIIAVLGFVIYTVLECICLGLLPYPRFILNARNKSKVFTFFQKPRWPYFFLFIATIPLFPFFVLSDFTVDSIQKFKKRKYLSHKEKLKNGNNFIEEEKPEKPSPQEKYQNEFRKYKFEFTRLATPGPVKFRENDFIDLSGIDKAFTHKMKIQQEFLQSQNELFKARQKLLEEQAKLNKTLKEIRDFTK